MDSMNNNELSEDQIIAHNRSKIYQKLERIPSPPTYKGNIPWAVQQQIAATNGMHYIDRIGKLEGYPQYSLPIEQTTGDSLMLDIGCGWGRWLVAGNRKGYIPMGLDIRLEFCRTARYVMKDSNVNGYAVVGDLENIPFKQSIFDLIWSFSVIQHTHKNRLINCLKGINSTLTSTGTAKLEFPNKNGVRNRFSAAVARNLLTADDYNSWDVRYYTPSGYREIFEEYLANFDYENHSVLGIGVLKEDLKYVSLKNKIPTLISLSLSQLARIIKPIRQLSDSIYITASKKGKVTNNTNALKHFMKLHGQSPDSNLNIIPLLKCPKYGGDLELNVTKDRLISVEAGIYYMIEDDIPILISSEARSL